MKKFIVPFLICFISLQLNAQEFNVSLSPPQNDSQLAGVFALPDGGFIAVKYVINDKGYNWIKWKESISVIHYDASMKQLKENTLSNGDKGFGTIFTSFKKINDRFWLIYIEPANKSVGDLKAVEIDPVSLEAGTPKTLLAADADGVNAALAGMARFDTKFKTSPVEHFSCLLLSTGEKNGFVCCLDEALNRVWLRKGVATDIRHIPRLINSMEIDDQGTVYLAYADKNGGHVAAYHAATAPQIVDVKIDNGKAKDVLVLAHKNGSSLTLAGGYLENSRNVRGVFKTNMDRALTIGGVEKFPFTESVVSQFDNDSWGSTKANKYGIEPNYLSQVFEVSDNAIDIVFEIKIQIDNDKLGTIVHSGSILSAYLDNGKATFARIPKYNVAVLTNYWNLYYAMPYHRKMVVFYNDNPINLTRDISVSPKQVDIEGNSLLVAAIIEPDGTVQRKLPLDLKQNYMGKAEWMMTADTNKLQVPIYFKKELAFATIAIQ